MKFDAVADIYGQRTRWNSACKTMRTL